MPSEPAKGASGATSTPAQAAAHLHYAEIVKEVHGWRRYLWTQLLEVDAGFVVAVDVGQYDPDLDPTTLGLDSWRRKPSRELTFPNRLYHLPDRAERRAEMEVRQPFRRREFDSASRVHDGRRQIPAGECLLNLGDAVVRFVLVVKVTSDLEAMIAAAKSEVGASLKVASGYRDIKEEMGIWNHAFDTIYLWLDHKTREKLFPDEPYGDAAAAWLAEKIASRKAVPGTSNHSNGIAVDITGPGLDINYDDQTGWRGSKV